MPSPGDPLVVARLLAPVLTTDERRTVMLWCREVAATDAHVAEDESDLLGRLAGVLDR